MASVKELAEKHNVVPGRAQAVIEDLGIEVDNGQFEADADELELIEASLAEQSGSTAAVLQPNPTIRDVAQALGLQDKEVHKTLVTKLKKMVTLTTSLDQETTEKLVETLGYEVEWASAEPKPKAKKKDAKPATSEVIRPPVVTILGHVDHGKTSLLDYIRKAKVAEGEHGGITQHIGAYQVQLKDGTISFLDTPGHAAFTQMRARGAQVTDIAVLVVAADDGIMPQTIEAISHAKSAEVPIVVAVNKIDKPDANPDKVLQQLTQHELVPESYGGDVITQNVSAITGEGVDDLLDQINVLAEVLELKADPKAQPEAVVVEAKLERGRGPVATVLVEDGTLKIGDILVIGEAWGKVKAMTDYKGDRLQEAGPSTPVEILGLSEVPSAGDRVEIVKNEREARNIVDDRVSRRRNTNLTEPNRKVTLRGIRELYGEADSDQALSLIIKADVHGSVEAVRGLLNELDIEGIDVKILHAGVGAITESDILLAGASDGIVVGFNVKPEGNAKSEATRQKVEIRTYNIIYELIEDIEAAVKGRLEPKYEEEYHGTVEVRVVFKLSRQGKVAGSHVTDGKILRNDSVRVKRGEELVFEGKLASLRNVKEDVREINAGQDCGIKFEGWEDFAEGDVVEAFELVQVNA